MLCAPSPDRRDRWFLRLLLVASASAAFVGPPAAGAATSGAYVYDRELAGWATAALELASLHTGSQAKTVPSRTYIRCYRDVASFEAPLLADGTPLDEARTIIAYYDGQGSVNLRGGTCARIHRFVAAAPLISAETATAVSTLLHETLHRQGLESERLTECYANEAVKYAGWLARWKAQPVQDDASWVASEDAGTRARDLALAQSARLVASEYRMPAERCLRLTRKRSWAQGINLAAARA